MPKATEAVTLVPCTNNFHLLHWLLPFLLFHKLVTQKLVIAPVELIIRDLLSQSRQDQFSSQRLSKTIDFHACMDFPLS